MLVFIKNTGQLFFLTWHN